MIDYRGNLQMTDKELTWNEPVGVTHAVFPSWQECFMKSVQLTIVPFSLIIAMLFAIISLPLLIGQTDIGRGYGILVGILIFYLVYLSFCLHFSIIRYEKGRCIIVNDKHIMCIGANLKWSELRNLCISSLNIDGNDYWILTGDCKGRQYMFGIDCEKVNIEILLRIIPSSVLVKSS
jgi:hypothetical protein